MREDNPYKYQTAAWQMFGKQWKDLNKDERRQYYTQRKRIERCLHPERKERDLTILNQWILDNPEEFRKSMKRWRENNKQRIKELHAEYRKRKGMRPHSESLIFKMFGVHGFDKLTIEQRREYLRVKQREYYRRKHEVLGRNK